MDYLAFLLSLIFLAVSWWMTRKKKAISPVTIFFALWSVILFLSILNLYNIYKPSNEAYFLIILMLVFFAIGSFIYMFMRKFVKLPSKICERKIKKESTIKPRFKLYYVLCSCIILFNIIDIIIIIKELANGNPMWQIRNWSLEPYGSSNPLLDRRSFLESIFRSVILAPAETIIPPITAYCFFDLKNKKQKYALLIISLLVLFSSSIAGGGGRLGFIYYIGCFLLAFFIFCKNKKISADLIKKYKKVMLIFVIIGGIFVIAYTTFRTGIGNFVKQTYTYFALPPTLLSIWLPSIKSVSHTWGMTSFFGIHSYLFRGLDTVGLDFLVPQIYNEAYSNILNAEIFKDVGYGIGNAFVTPIYYFFIDGGYPFVCIASFVFGCIITGFYEKFEENINIKSFAFYGLIMYGVFVSFMRIQTAIPAYIISFILVLILMKETKEAKKVKEDKLLIEDIHREEK